MHDIQSVDRLFVWQQHDDHGMSPKGYGSLRPSSGRIASTLNSGLILSRIAQGIFAIRGLWWRRWCGIGWTPMTSPEVRSLSIIKTPRAARLAMSRLFTHAHTCQRACTLRHLSWPLHHRECILTRPATLRWRCYCPRFRI